MIDVKAFCTAKPANMFSLDSYLEPEKYKEIGSSEAKLTDEDFLICAYTTPGFCFTTKKWCFFNVALIEEINFVSEAFETLLLPKHHKEMIYSLIKVHTSDGMGFVDLIRGTGRGMVFLLHGIPGTGKTLTAGMNPRDIYFKVREIADLSSSRRGCRRLYEASTLYCELWRAWDQYQRGRT